MVPPYVPWLGRIQSSPRLDEERQPPELLN